MNTTAGISKRLRVWTYVGILLLCVTLFPSIKNVQADPLKDWTTYLGSTARNNYAANENTINASNVGKLQVAWKFATKGSISSQSLYVEGIGPAPGSSTNPEIFFGSWDGNEYATDLTGHLSWSTYLGQSTASCILKPKGVTGTATIIPSGSNHASQPDQNTSVAYVAGGEDKLYALDASSGKILWKVKPSSSPNTFLWSSPAVYNGSVYIGVASLGDCPSARGALVQVNAATGAIQHTFNTVPDGCLGASIWSSPTIGVDTGTIFVTTGNPAQCSSTEHYAEALVELRSSDLSVIDSWQIPPSQQHFEADFGATPTLFTANIGGKTRRLVGAVNKNGIYYAFDRYNLHNGPLWEDRIGTGFSKDISSSAWDGKALYVGGRVTTIDGQNCLGSLRALDPATGKFIWQDCFNDGPVLAPVSAIPGVLFVGEGTHFLAVDASTGNILFNYPTAGIIEAPATISNGQVYIGDALGNLYAF